MTVSRVGGGSREVSGDGGCREMSGPGSSGTCVTSFLGEVCPSGGVEDRDLAGFGKKPGSPDRVNRRRNLQLRSVTRPDPSTLMPY